MVLRKHTTQWAPLIAKVCPVHWLQAANKICCMIKVNRSHHRTLAQWYGFGLQSSKKRKAIFKQLLFNDFSSISVELPYEAYQRTKLFLNTVLIVLLPLFTAIGLSDAGSVKLLFYWWPWYRYRDYGEALELKQIRKRCERERVPMGQRIPFPFIDWWNTLRSSCTADEKLVQDYCVSVRRLFSLPGTSSHFMGSAEAWDIHGHAV